MYIIIIILILNIDTYLGTYVLTSLICLLLLVVQILLKGF